MVFINEDILAESENEYSLSENQNNVEVSYSTNTGDEKSKFEWGDADTRLLLDLYHSGLPDVGPLKKYPNKKALWHYISQDIKSQVKLERTPGQRETRLKTILKRKTKIRKIMKLLERPGLNSV
ncbi:unnamed protein product [Psylliodes chrysocephalus]|uniref:Uncharacterized protein n=1 Tax=Psylliodes chrysocephalus TaxID=3402493 RepID=A0A9P0CYZ0_9CUCU|nr:unnamed protein product [Psylliodes chrysocephala]